MKKKYKEPKISILDMGFDVLRTSGPTVDDQGDAIWDFGDMWGEE